MRRMRAQQPTEPSAEHREQTTPGYSRSLDTQNCVSGFIPDTRTLRRISWRENRGNAIPQQAAPLNAPVSLPHRARRQCQKRVLPGSNISLLRAQTRRRAQLRHGARSPSPAEHMGVQNGERGGQDCGPATSNICNARCSDLAATVSSQAAHMRDESQAHRRERKTPPQRVVVVQRVDASSTTPRAFWERSRLGRLHLKTGR